MSDWLTLIPNGCIVFFAEKGVNNTVKFGFSSISSLAPSFVNGIMGRKEGHYSAGSATYAGAGKDSALNWHRAAQSGRSVSKRGFAKVDASSQWAGPLLMSMMNSILHRWPVTEH